MTTTARALPHDPTSEGIVLAAILNGGAAVLDNLDSLPADAFYIRSNRLIFDAANDLRNAGATVEPEAVIARLRDTGRLEEVGGVPRVAEIASGFVTSENVGFYAARVNDKAALRRAIDLGTRAVRLAYERQDDAEAVLADIEQDALRLRESSVRADQNELSAGCDQVVANIKMRENGKHGKVALPTGIKAWDEFFYGIMPGRQYLVAGRPGLGKTVLAETVAVNVASIDKQVLVISLEMSKDRLIERMAARMAGADFGKYLRGFPTAQESERMIAATDYIKRLPIHLWAPSGATAQQVRGLVRRAARRGVKLFVLDYFSRLQISGGDKRNEAFAAAGATITQAIKESGMSGIVLCQLTRESEKETLRLGHLAETRQLEQDADGVAFLDCADMKQEPREVTFAVEKNRDGALGMRKMLFNGPTMTFGDYGA